MACQVSGVTLVYMEQQCLSINHRSQHLYTVAWEGTGSFPRWDLSVAQYQLHLNLTSPPAVPADTSVLFCTLQVWRLQSEKEEGLSRGQIYKNIRGKLGEVQNHCKFLPALLCPAVFQKSHFSRLVQTPNKNTKASLLFWVTFYIIP